MQMHLKKKGIILIELLIVVAIIAILAASAVPNFLEAQTRAKVTSVRFNSRNVAMAIESYRIDNKRALPNATQGGPWPYNLIVNYFWASRWGYNLALSTPVVYMTSVPEDKFMKEYYVRLGYDTPGRFWEVPLFDNNILKAGLANPNNPSCPGIFDWNGGLQICQAAGQNVKNDFRWFHDLIFLNVKHDSANYAFTPWGPASLLGQSGHSQICYDPTNGTMSAGCIISYY
jgi:Tfp pilus assembly protein PilE